MGTKEYLENRLIELEAEIKGIKAALKAYEIASLGNSTIEDTEDATVQYESEINGNKIPKDGTWIEKILFVIKDRDRFMHNQEIAEALHPYYSDKTVEQVKKRISGVLSKALVNKTVDGLVNYRFTKSKKDTVWGKQAWLDENGKILQKYMYFNRNKNPMQKTVF